MEEIRIREKISYGIGAYGKDLVYALVATFLMVYYTDVVGVSPAFVGGLFLVARIWDAFNDPLMGWIVDNTKTKYGKFRPWILAGTVVNSIVLVLLYLNPNSFLQGSLVYVYCAVMYILWGMTYTIMDIPYWSMIPSFSSDSKVRDQMSVIPRLFAMFGGQTVNTFGLMIVAFLGTNLGGTESDGYFRFALAIAVLFNICELITFFNVKEHVVAENKEHIHLRDAVGLLRRNDQLIVIVVLTIIQQLSVYLFLGMNIYFFKYVIQNESWLAIFGIVSTIVQFASFVLFPKLVSKLSRKKVYVLSCLSFIFGLLGMFFTGASPEANPLLFFPFSAFFCVGHALALVSTTVMLADTVDYGEFKCGTRSEGIVFSIQTLTVKFGTAIAGFLGGMVLQVVGYVPNAVQSAETILGMRLVMFVLAAFLFACILVIYLKFYKLNGQFYKDMLSMLEVSRQQRRLEQEQSVQLKNLQVSGNQR